MIPELHTYMSWLDREGTLLYCFWEANPLTWSPPSFLPRVSRLVGEEHYSVNTEAKQGHVFHGCGRERLQRRRNAVALIYPAFNVLWLKTAKVMKAHVILHGVLHLVTYRFFKSSKIFKVPPTVPLKESGGNAFWLFEPRFTFKR